MLTNSTFWGGSWWQVLVDRASEAIPATASQAVGDTLWPEASWGAGLGNGGGGACRSGPSHAPQYLTDTMWKLLSSGVGGMGVQGELRGRGTGLSLGLGRGGSGASAGDQAPGALEGQSRQGLLGLRSRAG